MCLSTPLQLLTIVWQGTNKATGHSWERLNRSMQGALSLAIDSGMKFGLDDFAYIDEHFRPGWWMGNDGHMSGEGYYSQAITAGNMSAAVAFEKGKNRKPFITDNVTTGWHGPKTLSRSRLAILFSFYWNGETVTVTSFSQDGTYLTACSYKDKKPGEHETKIKRRYKVTIKGLRDLRKELKKIVVEQEALLKVKMPIAETAGMLARNNVTIGEAWKKIEEWNQKKERPPAHPII